MFDFSSRPRPRMAYSGTPPWAPLEVVEMAAAGGGPHPVESGTGSPEAELDGGRGGSRTEQDRG